MQFGAWIAFLRQKTNRERGVRDQQNSRRSGAEIAIDGVLGEMALALSLGQSYDHLKDTSPRSAANDHDQDLVLPNGDTVDVKTTCYKNADLQIAEHKQVLPATWYALAIRESPLINNQEVIVQIKGFVRGEDAMTSENLQRIPTRKNMPFFVVSKDDLLQELPKECFEAKVSEEGEWKSQTRLRRGCS